MLGVSKTRVSQLIETENFPDHWVRLQAGRIWRTEEVVRWALGEGRKVNYTIPESVSNRGNGVARNASRAPRTLSQWESGSVPGNLVQGDSGTGEGPTSSTGRAVTILPEEKEIQVAEKPESPSFASLTTSTHLAKSPESDAGKPRRSSLELNRLALAEDWDELERIFKTGKQDRLDRESEIQLVGLAAMVIASGGNVPNYRRTKDQMIKAWGEVRSVYSATQSELVALAQYVVATAQSPWSPGAVKRFSENQITVMRRGAIKPADGERKQPNRWQGGRNGQLEESISRMTDEQKRRFGVKGYTA
jgi:hypothetical protein